MWSDDGLQQRSPSSCPVFAFTIVSWVRITDMRLAEVGECARLRMDDGYLLGPREVVFKVLEKFAKGIKEGTGCELVAMKYKMFSMDATTLEDCHARGLIPKNLSSIE
jgi:hypothetical protein